MQPDVINNMSATKKIQHKKNPDFKTSDIKKNRIKMGISSLQRHFKSRSNFQARKPNFHQTVVEVSKEKKTYI